MESFLNIATLIVKIRLRITSYNVCYTKLLRATQTQFDFTGLVGGDHIVYVRDAQGCESEWNITFPESVFIDPHVFVEYGCDNNIPSNMVTVTVDDSVDQADLDYSLDGASYNFV